jgi:hypothetical protein
MTKILTMYHESSELEEVAMYSATVLIADERSHPALAEISLFAYETPSTITCSGLFTVHLIRFYVALIPVFRA